MGLKFFLHVWMNHIALNAGAFLGSVWHLIAPPQWTGHSSEDIDSLAVGTPIVAFRQGAPTEEAHRRARREGVALS